MSGIAARSIARQDLPVAQAQPVAGTATIGRLTLAEVHRFCDSGVVIDRIAWLARVSTPELRSAVAVAERAAARAAGVTEHAGVATPEAPPPEAATPAPVSRHNLAAARRVQARGGLAAETYRLIGLYHARGFSPRAIARFCDLDPERVCDLLGVDRLRVRV